MTDYIVRDKDGAALGIDWKRWLADNGDDPLFKTEDDSLFDTSTL